MKVSDVYRSTGGGHWYDHQGHPRHRVPTADGNSDRPTTIRDARKLDLLPSVTGIMSVLDKPGLTRWKLREAVKAAAASTFPDDPTDAWADGVIRKSKEQVTAAADLGSQIHQILEDRALGRKPTISPDLAAYVLPVLEYLGSRPIEVRGVEKSLVNLKDGYAGTADLLFRWNGRPGVLDYKTRKTQVGKPVRVYSEQAMQLSAYAVAACNSDPAWLPHCIAANVFISTTEPGRYYVHVHDPAELVESYTDFRACCRLWRRAKKYDPRTERNGT